MYLILLKKDVFDYRIYIVDASFSSQMKSLRRQKPLTLN